jgi:hypothetical protein
MSGELFEAPFNLAGEPQSADLTDEGQARVRALAEAEARKAQTFFNWESSLGGSAIRNFPLHDDTNENAL